MDKVSLYCMWCGEKTEVDIDAIRAGVNCGDCIGSVAERAGYEARASEGY